MATPHPIDAPIRYTRDRIRSFFQHGFLGIDIFIDRDLFNHAAAMSFFFLVSLPPLFLLIVLGLDKFVSSPDTLHMFMGFLERIEIGGVTREDLMRLGLLSSTSGIGNALGVIGIISLIWSGKGILESIQRGLAVVFSTPKKRSTWADTIFTFLMLLGLVLVLFAGAIVNAMLTFIIPSFLNYLPIGEEISPQLLSFFQQLVLLGVTTTAIFCLFRFVPLKRPSNMSAFLGAVLFSVSVYVLQLIVVHFFSLVRYNIVYGTLGSIVLLIVWVYFACVIFFAVATLIYVHEHFPSLLLSKAYNLLASHKKAGKLYTLLYGTPETALKDHTRSYQKGDIIFRELDEEKEVFYLLEGVVGVYLETEDGLKRLFSIGEMEILGLMASILKTPHAVWAISESDVSVLIFPSDMVSDMIHSGGTFALMVSKMVAGRLWTTIVQNEQKLPSQTTFTLPEKPSI